MPFLRSFVEAMPCPPFTFELLAHMRATEFIRPSLPLEVLKADRVEDILPRLRAAAARAPEGTKEMAPKLAQRL